MWGQTETKTPSRRLSTETSFRFRLPRRSVREYLRPGRADHHLWPKDGNQVGKGTQGGRHQLAVGVLQPKQESGEDVVYQCVSVDGSAVVGEMAEKCETDLGVWDEEHCPQLRHHVLLELLQGENWLEVAWRWARVTAARLLGAEQMGQELLSSSGVHEDKPAEEKRGQLKADDTGRQLPEQVWEGEEEGFSLWGRVEWQVSEKGDNREVGLLEVGLRQNSVHAGKPAHVGQKHLRSRKLPERRGLPVRALRQQLGHQEARSLHIFGSLLLLQFEPLETLQASETPATVRCDKYGSQAEAAVAAAGDVVQELESLKHVLEAEAECLLCLLPSHHRQRGGLLCEEVGFGGFRQPGDVSENSRMSMLCQVFGEQLHPSAFSELVVDEHGELALVPLLPLRKCATFRGLFHGDGGYQKVS